MPTHFIHAFRVFALCVLGSIGMTGTAAAQTNVMFIFDASGSMVTPVAGANDTRIGIAKKAMAKVLPEMPKDAHLGLMMYGHRRANDCTDLEIVSPIGADDAATIAKTIQAVQPKGETPIAVALRQAARNFTMLKGQNNSIVLVTDGIEECKGDPCAAANEIKASGLALKVDIVGFTLSDAQRKLIQCVPDATGGKFFEAKDLPSLNKALGEIRERTAQAAPSPQPAAPPAPPPPPAELNLLSASEGGQLLMAPDSNWTAIVTGKDGDGIPQTTAFGEAVFGFKNGQPATFSKFAIFIGGTASTNVKDFELLAADESVNGPFRSLGKFTTVNARMIKSPYQEFTFPETTAKYFKFKVLSSFNNDSWNVVSQLRLIGKPSSDAPAAAAPAPKAGDVNLLAASAGGQLLLAPDASWQAIVSGKDGEGLSQMTQFGEATFAFKDEKPAVFSRFEIYIGATASINIKDFELLAGDDLSGAYRSLGKFTTVNARMIQSPYQAFTFPETTAKYFKYKVLASFNNDHWNAPNQIRLFGHMAP